MDGTCRQFRRGHGAVHAEEAVAIGGEEEEDGVGEDEQRLLGRDEAAQRRKELPTTSRWGGTGRSPGPAQGRGGAQGEESNCGEHEEGDSRDTGTCASRSGSVVLVAALLLQVIMVLI